MGVASRVLPLISHLAQRRIKSGRLSNVTKKLRFRFNLRFRFDLRFQFNLRLRIKLRLRVEPEPEPEPETERSRRDPTRSRRGRVFGLRDEIEAAVRVDQTLRLGRRFWREIWLRAISTTLTVSAAAWRWTKRPRLPTTPNGKFTFVLKNIGFSICLLTLHQNGSVFYIICNADSKAVV
jgi:hypothetical protein